MWQHHSSVLKHLVVLQQQQRQLIRTCCMPVAWSVSNMHSLHLSATNGALCHPLQSLGMQQHQVSVPRAQCRPHSSTQASSLASSQACCTCRCEHSSIRTQNHLSRCTTMYGASQATNRRLFLSPGLSPLRQSHSTQHTHWSTGSAASVVAKGFSSKSRGSSGGFSSSKSSKPKVQYECQKCGAGEPVLSQCAWPVLLHHHSASTGP
jgi:hypothetical protein